MREKAITETSSENKIKLRFLLLTILLVIFYSTLLFSATIYIDPSNTASGQNGSIQNPYNSWNQVSFINGNSYLQKRGTIFNTASGISLTNKSNITIGAYGTGAKPVIKSNSATARIIRLTSSSNCTIKNLELSSTDDFLGAIGIGIDGTSPNALIDSCHIHSCEWGVSMFTTVGTSGIRILNTEIHGIGDDGIYGRDMKNLEIGNCQIYDVNKKYLINPDQSYSPGDCIQLVGNQSTTNALVVNIHHNTLDHTSTGNKFCIIIVGDYYSGNISNNTMVAGTSTSLMYLWHTTGTITVRNNVLKGGGYAIYSYVHDLQVHYNKIINTRLGITVLPSYLTQTSLTAYNNVFYDNVYASITISNSGSPLVSKNNTFYLIGSSAKAYSTGAAPVNSNYNNFNIQRSGFINSYSTLTSWRSASGNDMNSYVGDPLFVSPSTNNFSLQPGSACINTGTNVNLQTDFFGTPVPQGNTPDIGHHEYLNNGGSNLSPVIYNQNFQLNENSANATTVGTVVASDPNSGQSISFTIVGGNTNNAFSINASSGILTVANSLALNFESSPVFSLTVRATDNGTGNLYAQATIAINLVNVNENPIIANQSYSVAQNAANGTIVANVAASDPDQGQTLSYSITNGNTNSAFTINSSSGRITVANSGSVIQGPFYLTVRATDNGNPALWSVATVTITVTTSANQAPQIAPQSFSITQGTSNGTSIGTVYATDPNSGQTLTFSITAGNTNSVFAISSSTGNLIVNNTASLLVQTYSLTVRATDNGSPVLYSQATITINVTSSSNAAPLIANQSFNVAQGAANGTSIGNVVASDPNSGQTLSYSIISGNTSSVFAINTLNGHLIINNTNSLIVQAYSLTVRVTDNGTPTLYSQAIITINVTSNINLSPVINNQTFNTIQNSSNGTLVGTITASDQNAGQTLSFTIVSGNTNSVFALNSSTGNLTVANSGSLMAGSFMLIVRVTDNGSPTLWSQATITVNVSQQTNQAPTIANQSFSTNENVSNATFIGTILASDPNAGQVLSYSIINGNTNNAFAINSTNGRLSVNNSTAINYESINRFSLTVRATDNGAGNLWAQATITVNVINVNEAPVLNASTFSIREFASNGTFVGVVRGSDPDAGQSVTYQIVSGNTSNAFTLNASNGAINVINSQALNADITPFFNLTVRIKDNAQPSLSSTGIITINVTPVKNGEDIADSDLNEVEEEAGYNIYPNPSYDGIFNIKSGTNTEAKEIQVFDMSGKLIYKKSPMNEQVSKLDLSNQPDGVYIVKIISEKKLFTYKAIKN